MRRRLLFITLALIIGVSMSLFDTDKHSEDRGNPVPNHTDALNDGSVKAHKTISSHYTSDADSTTSRLQMQNKQIVGSSGSSQIVNYGVQTDGNFALKFFDANGVGVARFGQYPGGSVALKVAKSGQEVDTATNDQLIFNSSQNVFKIVASYSMSTTVNLVNGNPSTNFASTTVAHGLSYTPAFTAYIITPASLTAVFTPAGLSNHPNPALLYGTVGANVTLFGIAEVSVDATNVQFSAQLYTGFATAAYTFTTKVYLLQETFN